jgi:hypothetical protein
MGLTVLCLAPIQQVLRRCAMAQRELKNLARALPRRHDHLNGGCDTGGAAFRIQPAPERDELRFAKHPLARYRRGWVGGDYRDGIVLQVPANFASGLEVAVLAPDAECKSCMSCRPDGVCSDGRTSAVDGG